MLFSFALYCSTSSYPPSRCGSCWGWVLFSSNVETRLRISIRNICHPHSCGCSVTNADVKQDQLAESIMRHLLLVQTSPFSWKRCPFFEYLIKVIIELLGCPILNIDGHHFTVCKNGHHLLRSVLFFFLQCRFYWQLNFWGSYMIFWLINSSISARLNTNRANRSFSVPIGIMSYTLNAPIKCRLTGLHMGEKTSIYVPCG